MHVLIVLLAAVLAFSPFVLVCGTLEWLRRRGLRYESVKQQRQEEMFQAFLRGRG